MTTSSSSSHSNFDKGKDHMGKGQALVVTSSQDSGRWLLESGASHHMASSQSMFSAFVSLVLSLEILDLGNSFLP